MINPPRHGKKEAERRALLALRLQEAVTGSSHDHVMQVLKEQGDYPEVNVALGELQRAVEEGIPVTFSPKFTLEDYIALANYDSCRLGRCVTTHCYGVDADTCLGRGTEKCCEY